MFDLNITIKGTDISLETALLPIQAWMANIEDEDLAGYFTKTLGPDAENTVEQQIVKNAAVVGVKAELVYETVDVIRKEFARRKHYGLC